ncbi:MAG: hypothetical protein KGK44_01450 [Gammaproteobacteria bacterium]|nr:hypothetical protein [Gammaproteobacteria bacterium]
MNAVVLKPYRRPYSDPIVVKAGDTLHPDFAKQTDIDGWVGCTAEDGRSGWTPRGWMQRAGEVWRITRDFNALELTIQPGEILDIVLKQSGFYWARKSTGGTGWVPCLNVGIARTV